MQLIDVTVWWNCEDAHNDHLDRPQIKILNYHARGNSKYAYLDNSNGACCGGWENMGGYNRAAALLAMVLEAVVKDGVPPAQARKELLQIDEYVDYVERFEGPFSEVYRGEPAKEDAGL